MTRKGTTVFVTTHYMDEADYLVTVWRSSTAGKIIAEGTPSELRRAFMTRSILEIEAEPLIGAMEALARMGIETALFGSVLHATVEDVETAIPRITRILGESNIALRKIDKIVPSLEDVFVTLIEQS